MRVSQRSFTEVKVDPKLPWNHDFNAGNKKEVSVIKAPNTVNDEEKGQIAALNITNESLILNSTLNTTAETNEVGEVSREMS